MTDLLTNYAIKNIWCNPDQDRQFIFEAGKVSPPFGYLNQMRLMDRVHTFPKQGVRYHVFQIGQLHPSAIGLLNYDPLWFKDRWVKFSEVMKENNLIVTLYNKEGVCVPVSKSYYCFTKERALVFIVESDPRIPLDYLNDTIYLRLYSNAFYQDSQPTGVSFNIDVYSKEITHRDHLLEVQTKYKSYLNKVGACLCYLNGLKVDSLGPMNVKIGDYVEIIYDASIKREVRFSVAELPVFFSELDGCNKYLLHHLCDEMGTIDFQDDIDIYLIKEDKHNRYRGIYHHRNQWNNHRMVTHRDYAIKVDHVLFLSQALSSLISSSPISVGDMTVQLYIRRSGYERPLVYDNSRIFELYKLPHEKILQAMVGVHSTLDIWKAAKLEASAYSLLMGVDRNEITTELVQDALGYNSISKILGDTPIRARKLTNYAIADIKPSQYLNSTIYEYDAQGVLLDWTIHKRGLDFVSTTTGVESFEILSGKGGQCVEAIYGTNFLSIPKKCDYRVYMCYLVDDKPNGDWKDITDTDNYRIENNTLIWDKPESGQYLMVRTDSHFLSYDIELSEHLGQLSFDIQESVKDADGQLVKKTMEVPMGHLDLFLNGHSLIRGLDYVLDFPKVNIINTRFLRNDSTQHIHVRFYGFCTDTLELDPIEDFGFIQHGFLSNNNRFDIRDDKVLRIVVNGKMRHREDVKFSEEHDGVSIINSTNGMPYQIKDILVPTRAMTTKSARELRKLSQEIDKKVSDYLTLHLPQPKRDQQDFIPERYPLVSPFSSGLLDAIESGRIDYDTLSKTITDSDIIQLCKPFEHLLAFDPINEDLGFDLRYVMPVAHRRNKVVVLRFHQFRVYKRAMMLYGKDKLDTTVSVVIKPE